MKNLAKILPYAERLCLILLLVGAIMQAAEMGGMILIALALTGLATVFFLGSYVPLEVAPKEKEGDLGFTQLLVLSIIPRVLGISMSVAMVGIMFNLLQLEGYETMLAVGSATILTVLLITVALKLTNAPNVALIWTRMIRAIIVVVAVVLVWQQGGATM